MPRTTTKTATKRTASKNVSTKKMTSGIISVDNGGHFTKILAEGMKNPIAISSKKARGHNNFKTQTDYEKGTYKIEYNGSFYFMGELIDEGTGKMTSFTTSKATDYFIISTLQAVALYGFDNNIVVTNVPFKRYSDKEREKIENKLIGHHTIVINDEEYEFDIEEVVVTPEVSMAFFNDMPEGIVHWLDFGSRTVGYATTKYNGEIFRPIEKQTGTIERQGLDIRKTQDFVSYVSEISDELLRHWDADEPVIAFGGGIEYYPQIAEELVNYFNDVTVVEEEAKFLQVRGMLEFAKLQYAEIDEDEEGEEE